MAAETTNPSYALDVSPETSLHFVLTRTDATGSESEGIPRCTMTLTHPGKSKEPLAFKVKTTQPRRYLVRPNQGVIHPGSAETIALILVEKDKQSLLQSYDRLGQSALDQSKDKFLVQSCVVSEEFAKKFPKGPEGDSAKNGKELTDAITSMWNRAVTESLPIYNKKLHVRHVVRDNARPLDTIPGSEPGSSVATTSSPPFESTEKTSMEGMTDEQVRAELSSWRRKYNELVTFSVNLTSERDVINNELEQTKRDLSREMTARNSLENNGGKEIKLKRQLSGDKGFSLSLIQALVLAIACFVAGLKTSDNVINAVGDIPVLSTFLEKSPMPESLSATSSDQEDSD
jgi:hypothetical protein